LALKYYICRTLKQKEMTIFTFETDKSEAVKIRTILKALGVKKLKIIENDDTEMSKDEFEEKLKRAKSGDGTILRNADDVNAFFNSL
jgi:16S rRNA C967 or C1407 C5-methylase (RsmB/RsmF family)